MTNGPGFLITLVLGSILFALGGWIFTVKSNILGLGILGIVISVYGLLIIIKNTNQGFGSENKIIVYLPGISELIEFLRRE